MSDQKHGEMITDEQIAEAVDTLAAVARAFVPDGWSIHLQCYRGGEVFSSLCRLSEQCQEEVVSLHETYQDAIDAAMRIEGNTPKNLEGSIDIPELRVPILFWACTDCPGDTVTWNQGIATCGNCGRKSAD